MTAVSDQTLHPQPSPVGRWTFFGPSSLPADPVARSHEKRGRKWLFFSYFLCPCHIPITLGLFGVAFGGTAVGAALTGNALRVRTVLTMLYALVLWRGFRQIRRAKRIETAGGTLACTPDGCEVTPGEPGRDRAGEPAGVV